MTNLKLIEASGSHRKIGREIGESAREEIRHNIDLFLDGIDYGAMKEVSTYIARCNMQFPRFMDELRGMSEGANQRFLDILLFNLEEEIYAADHCTTFTVKANESVFLAHNEDWHIDMKFYIVKSKPDDKPGYISLDYAGQLSGSSVGLNEKGVGFSGNSIESKINPIGLPKIFLLRYLLEASDISDLERLMAKGERSIGNNSLLVFSNQKMILDIEWTPDRYDIMKPQGNYYVHTNHYLSPILKKVKYGDTDYIKQSKFRLKRTNQLLKEAKSVSIVDIKRILSDHKGRQGIGSICKHLKEDAKVGSNTIASVVVEVLNGKLHACYGNPCRNGYTTFSL
jgi:isopenicillin-N N-acyltransferase-like protein